MTRVLHPGVAASVRDWEEARDANPALTVDELRRRLVGPEPAVDLDRLAGGTAYRARPSLGRRAAGRLAGRGLAAPPGWGPAAKEAPERELGEYLAEWRPPLPPAAPASTGAPPGTPAEELVLEVVCEALGAGRQASAATSSAAWSAGCWSGWTRCR